MHIFIQNRIQWNLWPGFWPHKKFTTNFLVANNEESLSALGQTIVSSIQNLAWYVIQTAARSITYISQPQKDASMIKLWQIQINKSQFGNIWYTLLHFGYDKKDEKQTKTNKIIEKYWEHQWNNSCPICLRKAGFRTFMRWFDDVNTCFTFSSTKERGRKSSM